MLKRTKAKPLDLAGAEEIGIQALAFLAGDDNRIAKFLGLTGITADALVAGARTSPMLLAVLEHMSQDETLLLVFATEAGLPPERISQAIALLEAAT
jgi:hypothetical protein